MHNTMIVLRLAAVVLMNVGAVMVAAWMDWIHGDLAGGLAMGGGLAFVGWMAAPSMMDVQQLIDELQQANKPVD